MKSAIKTHFVRDTHREEGFEITTQSKQHDLKGIVQIIAPGDVALHRSPLLLPMKKNVCARLPSLFGKLHFLIDERVVNRVHLLDQHGKKVDVASSDKYHLSSTCIGRFSSAEARLPKRTC